MLREEPDVHETVHGGVHREEEELSEPSQVCGKETLATMLEEFHFGIKSRLCHQ